MGIENEITVKILGDINETCKILESKGFTVSNKCYYNDIFMIPDTIKNQIKTLTAREILKSAILIRDWKDQKENTSKLITFKKKEIDENGNILSQEKINCKISDVDEAINLFRAINYYKLMNIAENDVIYIKDGLEIDVKDIENGENLIEVETVLNSERFDTIEKIKEEVLKLELPINTSDFFIKKAEIELEKLLKK